MHHISLPKSVGWMLAVFIGVQPISDARAQNSLRLGVIDGATTGSGKIKTETRDVAEFDSVEIASGADVVIAWGNARKLSVTSDDNIVPLVQTEVRGRRLYISTRGGYSTQLGVTVDMTLPSLRELVSTSSSDIRLKDVKQGSLRIEVTGSGDVEADGRVDALVIKNTGAADFRLGRLKAERVDIELARAGDAEVWATQTLNAVISGSGTVTYHGGPKITRKISGAGELVKAD